MKTFDEIEFRQRTVDRLIDQWPLAGWRPVLNWAEAFTEAANDVAVRFDKVALARRLEAAGYVDNFGVGKPDIWFKNPDNCGGYIMGQIINCLKSGMPPHQVTLNFIERFRCEFPHLFRP